jgi:pimeloyl-ACP methyl ester carboxylesterase
MAGMADSTAKAIVLVHGGFVDGSGWEDVYRILKKDGYTVTIVQNPTTSLEDDVAVTRRALATQRGPVILVGHSYGGAVITEAGNDPKVVGLVYISAFAPDKGESVSTGSMENQAELVFDRHPGQDDSAAGATLHVEARGFESRRGRGQPCNLRVSTKCCCNAD